MDAIRCVGLTRHYGSVEALTDLDLAVPAGAVFGFLGRNGAGKTTAIRLLTGLARPTRGEAWVAGIKTTDGSDQARAMFGYLPEEPAFYGWMNPAEFLSYAGSLYELQGAARKERVAEVLELAGLASVGKRRIGGFSRGMRQRLGLAQAILHRPPVLFLDEPTSALDPAGRRDVLALIDRLRGETTVFLSSHILGDVERVCDTIGVIHEGRLLLVAGRDELLARHAGSTAALEFDQSTRPGPPLLASLRARPWVQLVTQTDNTLQVTVSNLDQGKADLLPLVLQEGLIVNRFEWLRPSLEDIFLSLSAETAGQPA